VQNHRINLDFDLFLKRKSGGPSPRVHHGPHSGRWLELTKARPSGRSGPRLLAARWGKEGGRHGDSILPSIEAWKAVRRRHTGRGTSAQKGDDVGMAERRRGQADGVGVFHRGSGRGAEAVKAG
jgi:hypothetical protein